MSGCASLLKECVEGWWQAVLVFDTAQRDQLPEEAPRHGDQVAAAGGQLGALHGWIGSMGDGQSTIMIASVPPVQRRHRKAPGTFKHNLKYSMRKLPLLTEPSSVIPVFVARTRFRRVLISLVPCFQHLHCPW